MTSLHNLTSPNENTSIKQIKDKQPFDSQTQSVEDSVFKYKLNKELTKTDININLPSTHEQPKCTFLQSKKSKIIFFTAIAAVLAIGIILIVLWQTGVLSKTNNNNNTQSLLIVNIKRELNEVSRYKEIKHSTSSMTINNTSHENKEQFTTDVILNIHNIIKLQDNTNLYEAHLLIISLYVLNETNTTSQNELTEGINIYNISNINTYISSLSQDEINSLPIMKVSFYENGTINDMQVPLNISSQTKETMQSISSKIIPSIAKELYIETTETPSMRMLEDNNIEGGNANYYTSTGKEVSLYNVKKHSVSEGDVQFHNSNVNALTETTVDNEEGVIKDVKSKGDVTFTQSDLGNENYGEYQIRRNSPLAGVTNGLNNNIFKSDFNAVSSSFQSELVFTNKTINENTTRLINDIATYVKFVKYNEHENIDNENNNNNTTTRLLQMLNIPNAKVFTRNISQIQTITSSNELKRLLKVENFLQPIEFAYPIFKYDHVGLLIHLTSLILIDTNTGIVTLTSLITIGSTTIELLKREHNTQLGSILDNADNTLEHSLNQIESLITQTKAKEQQWIEQLNTVLTPLKIKLDSTYNVGPLYREPIKEVYATIQQYSINIFEQMNTFINNQHIYLNNTISVLHSSHYTQLNELNDIINSFLNECQQYFISAPNSVFDIFYNDSIAYTDAILDANDNIIDFDINIYYDIVDQVQKGRNIYETFLTKFMNIIERGLTVYSNEMQFKSNELLSEALNAVEYIGTAIENNIIISEVISENRREQTAKGAYAFRNSISSLIEKIFIKINEAYNANINNDDTNAMKNQLENTVNSMLNEFNTKTESMLHAIKNKIPNIAKYEAYITNHPNIIDSIENELLEIEQQQLTELISNPLYKLHRQFYSPEQMNEINNLLTTNAKSVVNQLYSDKQQASEILSTNKNIIDTSSTEEQYANEFFRINKKIFEGLEHEKSLLHHSNFGLFIDKAEKTLLNIIQLNYQYGRNYMTDINTFYEQHRYANYITERYRTDKYEQRSQMSSLYTNEFVRGIENNLHSYIKDAYLSLGHNLQSYIETQLIPADVDLTKYESMAVVREYIDKILEFVESKINATMFNEDNFVNVFQGGIDDIITNAVNLNNKLSNEYTQYKNTLIDDLPLCVESTKIKCDYDLIFYSEGFGGIKHLYEPEEEFDKIVKELTNEYFNTNIIQLVFNDFADAHLKLPLNEFKSKVIELYSSMSQMEEEFSDLTPFKTLMNKYETQSLNIIKTYLGEKLLTNLYKAITNGLNSRIGEYFSQIANKLSLLNTNYISSHLKQTITQFLDSDEPSEIIIKLNTLKFTQEDKGRTILEDIEVMLMNEFDLIIESCYLTIENILNSTISDIESNLPEFPFKELIRPRKEYLTTKVNSIRETFINSKEVFANITIRSFVLGVSEKDFFNIMNTNILLFKRIVGDPIAQYANTASYEIERNAKYLDINFNKNDFQAAKLRTSLYYFNEIQTLTLNRILNAQEGKWNVFTSNDIITRFNHATTYNYKINELIDDMSTVLNELNEVTQSKLEPYFESAKQNIRNVFEETTNDKVMKAQILEYTNSLYSIFISSNEDIKQLYNNYKQQLKMFFIKETDTIHNKPEYKEGRPYYIDQTRLAEKYQEYVTQILSNIEIVRSSINNLELDEKIIAQTKEEYYMLLNNAIDMFSSKILALSQNIPQYELLNLTYTFTDLFNSAMNNTYFDIIKHNFDTYANSILKDKFGNIKSFLSSEIEILHKNISELMNEEFNNFINIFLRESTEPVNDTVFVISDFSILFSNNITSLISTFGYQTFNLFENEPIKQRLLLSIPQITKSFVFNINDSHFQTQVEASDYIFREASTNRYIAEMVEFKEEYLYNVLRSNFEKAVDDFISIDGDLFGRKIYNKIVNVDTVLACRIAEEKLNFIYQYLEYVLNKMSLISSSTNVKYNKLLPDLVSLLQGGLVNKSESVFEEYLNMFKNELADVFINTFKDTVLNSDYVKGAFSDRVISVIKRAFSLGYDYKFKEHFVNAVNDKWVSVWKGKLSEGVETQINTFVSSVLNVKHELLQILLNNIEVSLIDSSFIMILNHVNNYKISIETCSNTINELTFAITNFEPFEIYLNNTALPLLQSIDETYSVLQNNLLTKIDEVLNQFDNYASLVSTEYQTETVVAFANEVYENVITIIDDMKQYIINLSKETSNRRMLNEHLPSYPQLRNMIEDTIPDINIKQLTDALITLEQYLSTLREGISTSQPIVNLINSLFNFQSKLQTGLIQISNPVTSLTTKLATFLTEDKLNTFKTLIGEQITEVNDVINNHNTRVSTSTQIVIDTLTDLYITMSEIKNSIEHNVKTTIEKSLKEIKQDIDPIHILESFDVKPKSDIQIKVNVLNIPFTFTFGFDCRYVYNVYQGMSGLSLNTTAFLGTQLNFASSAGITYVGKDKYTTTVNGNVQMSEIRIASVIDLRKFTVHLDALINFHPINVRTYMTRYYCKRLLGRRCFTKVSLDNTLKTEKITKNIPIDY